jgi:hypothetical protein
VAKNFLFFSICSFAYDLGVVYGIIYYFGAVRRIIAEFKSFVPIIKIDVGSDHMQRERFVNRPG